jgi:hypothetical protein
LHLNLELILILLWLILERTSRGSAHCCTGMERALVFEMHNETSVELINASQDAAFSL